MNSKKKHNISFTKPSEPAFITRLKQQAGYVEGPTVDTKKEELPQIDDEDCDDRDDERPTVVVMNDGDLTAEEAELFAKATKPDDKKEEKADLSQKVIFKRKKKTDEADPAEPENAKESKKKKKPKTQKSILSFNDEEEDE